MVQHIIPGMTAEDLGPKRFIRIHYSADKQKDKAWAEAERAGEADTRDWDKQMEMRRIVTDGLPVFARYNDSVHCPEWTHKEYLPLVPGSQYFGGWDAGQTLSPAFVLTELTPDLQIRDLLEVITIAGESMEEFAPMVEKTINDVYPGLLPNIRHRGDDTIGTRNGSNKVTAQQVARKYGFEIERRSNEWSKRSSAVAFQLNLEPGRYIVSGKGCPVLRRGFQGMYKFTIGARGGTQGAAAVVMQPLKNGYSHVHDAKQYAALDIFDLLLPGGTGWATDVAVLNALSGKTTNQ